MQTEADGPSAAVQTEVNWEEEMARQLKKGRLEGERSVLEARRTELEDELRRVKERMGAIDEELVAV